MTPKRINVQKKLILVCHLFKYENQYIFFKDLFDFTFFSPLCLSCLFKLVQIQFEQLTLVLVDGSSGHWEISIFGNGKGEHFVLSLPSGQASLQF